MASVRLKRLLLCVAAVAGLLGATSVWADPPGRVGRLANAQGQVWLFDPDANEWVDANVNRPLTTGDRLATDPQAHADIRIGSTIVRLDGGTQLQVSQLDDERMAFVLQEGSIAATVRDQQSARQFEVGTLEGRFNARRTGSYRFDRAGNESRGTVSSGELLFEGNGASQAIYPGQQVSFFADPGGALQTRTETPAQDEFATWIMQREAAERRVAPPARYVSPEMTGAEDLGRYGAWESSADYGPIWTPTQVAVGWAPYQTGHWVFMQPWGWTWVDDAPWGFAPFHYGRWVHYRNRWCWAPGTYVARPTYAPALVAWVGGGNVSVSVGIGAAPSVGWFPLAPREVYVPAYRVTPRYVRHVNSGHVTNITNINVIVNNPQAAWQQQHFRNRDVPRAVTVVPRQVMEQRRPVAPAIMPFKPQPQTRDARDRGRAGGPPPARVPAALVAPPVTAPHAVRAQPAPANGVRAPAPTAPPPKGWRPKLPPQGTAEHPRAHDVQRGGAPLPTPTAPLIGQRPGPAPQTPPQPAVPQAQTVRPQQHPQPQAQQLMPQPPQGQFQPPPGPQRIAPAQRPPQAPVHQAPPQQAMPAAPNAAQPPLPVERRIDPQRENRGDAGRARSHAEPGVRVAPQVPPPQIQSSPPPVQRPAPPTPPAPQRPVMPQAAPQPEPPRVIQHRAPPPLQQVQQAPQPQAMPQPQMPRPQPQPQVQMPPPQVRAPQPAPQAQNHSRGEGIRHEGRGDRDDKR